MKLSVIILNYNVRYFLELCLHSVEKAIQGIDAEIIVVDNDSTDKSVEMVEAIFPKVKIIQNLENVGFAKANNQGVSEANGVYICILNPDTVVAEDTFKNILKFAETNQKLGIVGCRLIDGSGNFLPESKRNIPTTKVAFRKLFGNPRWYYAQHIKEDENAEVEILVGAIMLMKKSVFDEVNGFDEDYFMYAEDVDLSYKVLKTGCKNHYLGSETIIHFKGESTVKDSKYLRRFYGSMQIFYKKHFRKNPVFDALVWLGIRLIPIFKGQNSKTLISSNKAILISDKNNVELQDKLEMPLDFQTELNTIQDNTTYIFDTSRNSFKSIIDRISSIKNTQNFKFRFYIPKSNFVIGSDSSEGRGEIINL